MPEIGRNDPCPCGSGKKYKKCCQAKDEAKEHAVVEKQWTAAEKKFETEKAKEAKETETSAAIPEKTANPHKKNEPAKPAVQKHTTFLTPKYNMPRKSGGGG